MIKNVIQKVLCMSLVYLSRKLSYKNIQLGCVNSNSFNSNFNNHYNNLTEASSHDRNTRAIHSRIVIVINDSLKVLTRFYIFISVEIPKMVFRLMQAVFVVLFILLLLLL